MIFIRVDFPEPDVPIIATISPGKIVRLISLSAATECAELEKVRLMFFKSIIFLI